MNKKFHRNSIVCALILSSLASSLYFSPVFAEQTYAQKGAEQLNKKNYLQSIELLKRAIEQDSNDSVSVYNRGQAYRNLGKYKEAIADYTRYLELAPEDSEIYLVYHNRGVCYNAEGDYSNAIADFDQALSQNSSYSQTNLERGSAYLGRAQSGDNERALSDASVYISSNTNEAAGYVLRGKVNSALGKVQDALDDMNKAIAIDPSGQNYCERGRVFHESGQYDKAIGDYDKVLSMNPYDGNTFYNRALSNKAREQYKAAIEDFDKSLTLIPNDFWAILERGRSKVFVPDYRGALEDFSKIIDINPDYCEARYERAEINLKLKLPDAALQDLNTAISKGKAIPQWYALRALAQARLGDFNKAALDLQSADSLYEMLSEDEKPSYIESQAYAGLAEVLLGKSLEASKRLDKAINLAGTNVHNVSKAMLFSARGLANARLNKGSLASADSGNAKSLSNEWGDLASFLGSGSITTTAAGSQSSSQSSQSTQSSGGTNRPIRDKWALVVGISDFKDGTIPKLKYSAKDARDFREFLIKRANFQPDHVRLLVNRDATRMRIMTELGDKFLPRVVQPDDLVVLYFSSHGSPSNADFRDKNYFIAYDSEKSNLFASGIELQELMKVIKNRVETNRVIVILDACHSGAADANAKATEAVANFDASELIGDGQLVICSSEAAERSYESKRYQNGVFTKALMEGLFANGANTKLKDAFEVLKYKVNTEVKEDDGQRQTPVLKSQWNGDDVSLALPPSKPRPLPATVKQLLAPDSVTVAPKK